MSTCSPRPGTAPPDCSEWHSSSEWPPPPPPASAMSALQSSLESEAFLQQEPKPMVHFPKFLSQSLQEEDAWMQFMYGAYKTSAKKNLHVHSTRWANIPSKQLSSIKYWYLNSLWFFPFLFKDSYDLKLLKFKKDISQQKPASMNKADGKRKGGAGRRGLGGVGGSTPFSSLIWGGQIEY